MIKDFFYVMKFLICMNECVIIFVKEFIKVKGFFGL